MLIEVKTKQRMFSLSPEEWFLIGKEWLISKEKDFAGSVCPEVIAER